MASAYRMMDSVVTFQLADFNKHAAMKLVQGIYINHQTWNKESPARFMGASHRARKMATEIGCCYKLLLRIKYCRPLE
jgi:hypothetical protein